LTEHCIFCNILRNKKTASYVYEDNRTIAILDIRPVNEGHTLVIPKKHYENLYEIPDEEVAHLFTIVRKRSHRLQYDASRKELDEVAGRIRKHLALSNQSS